MTEFDEEVAQRLARNSENRGLHAAALAFTEASTAPKYSYNFSWLGRPIIQYPQDIVAMQEIVWSIKPDLIIETGVAHGGSVIFYASMLELNAVCGGPADASVIGIDIDIRAHNRAAIEAHPLFRRIRLIEGSSVDPGVVAKVAAAASHRNRVIVCLDSNHTHAHVLKELESYAHLTSIGSYCVVFDTIIEDLAGDMYPDRPWGRGDNPKTAVREFLAQRSDFKADQSVDDKLLISMAPGGYLKRVG